MSTSRRKWRHLADLARAIEAQDARPAPTMADALSALAAERHSATPLPAHRRDGIDALRAAGQARRLDTEVLRRGNCRKGAR